VAQIFYARVSREARAPFDHIAADIFNLRNGIFCSLFLSFLPISFDPTTIGMDNCELSLDTQAGKRTSMCKTSKWTRFIARENNEQQSFTRERNAARVSRGCLRFSNSFRLSSCLHLVSRSYLAYLSNKIRCFILHSYIFGYLRMFLWEIFSS